jgi:hypothetical protein
MLALEQTRFFIPILDQDTNVPIQVGARYLFNQGVIDHTVPVRPDGMYDSQVTLPEPNQLRAALGKMLEEVSHVSPTELLIRRKERIERIAEMASRSIRLGKRIGTPSLNGLTLPPFRDNS